MMEGTRGVNSGSGADRVSVPALPGHLGCMKPVVLNRSVQGRMTRLIDYLPYSENASHLR